MRQWTLRITLAAVFLTFQPGTSSAAPEKQSVAPAPSTGQLSRDAVIHDLVYFRDAWAPKERSFTPDTRAQFNTFIADQISRARPMSKAELALVFAQGEAYTRNAHSEPSYLQTDGLFHTLPISFWTSPSCARSTAMPGRYLRN